MPLLTGRLDRGWAVLDVLAGVGTSRRQLLGTHGLPVPPAVPVRAVVDTGAALSGFAPRVFRALDLVPVLRSVVLTASTPADAPHECDFYDLSLAVVAAGTPHPFADFRVMEADCWHPAEGFDALIGMDLLARCFFQLNGPEGWFTLAF